MSRRLSDDQMERVAIMREGAASYGEIVSMLAEEGVTISPGAVAWHCLRMAAFPPQQYQERWTGSKQRAPHKRGGVTVRAFTPEDDETLLRLEAQGLGYRAIGRELGRSSGSVQGRLLTLARRDALEEAA